jgi:hypothetical protein
VGGISVTKECKFQTVLQQSFNLQNYLSYYKLSGCEEDGSTVLWKFVGAG